MSPDVGPGGRGPRRVPIPLRASYRLPEGGRQRGSELPGISSVGGGDHTVPTGPAPACKETLAWSPEGPVCLPRSWLVASPWGGLQA